MPSSTRPDGSSAADQALNGDLPRALVARFWSHAKRDRDYDPENDRDGLGPCLLWTGARTKAGYGTFSVGDVKVLAHRLAWRIRNGPIPPDTLIRHRCDVPRCLRPSHLEPGTTADNMRDAVKRGRHGTARLTIDQVRRIRELRETGETMPAIAAAIDSTPVLVRNVLRGISYTWVDADDTPSTPDATA